MLALILLGVATLVDSIYLTAASILIFTLTGLSWLWGRFSLNGLDYRRQFSEQRAFRGEIVQLELEVHNHKLLPLTWLNIVDNFLPHFLLGIKNSS